MGRKATDPTEQNSRKAELPGGPLRYRIISDGGGNGTSVSRVPHRAGKFKLTEVLF
jgi:hypothetical protein